MGSDQYPVQPKHTGASQLFDNPPSTTVGHEVAVRSQPPYEVTSPLCGVLRLLRLHLECFDTLQKLRCLRADVSLIYAGTYPPSEIPIGVALDGSSDEGSFPFRELPYLGQLQALQQLGIHRLGLDAEVMDGHR